jgi:hypothetical protein
MREAISYSETSVLTKPRDVTSQKTTFFIVTTVKTQILHSINRLSFVTESNVFPVRYELGFYIPEEDILHSHRRE